VIEESAFRHLNTWMRDQHFRGNIVGDFDPTTLFFAQGENRVECADCMHARGQQSRWLMIAPFERVAPYRFLPQCDVGFRFEGASLIEHQLWDWVYLEHLLYGIRLRSNGLTVARLLELRHAGAYRGVAQQKACAAGGPCVWDCRE
jgi:hypothetical protein